MFLTPHDGEWVEAWQRLSKRYSGLHRGDRGERWEYCRSKEINGEWWHEFLHPNHPRIGRVRDIVSATPGWKPPRGNTLGNFIIDDLDGPATDPLPFGFP